MKIFKQSFLLLFVLLAAFLCLTSCKKTDPCPNGHNFAIWETVTRATCGVAGLESSECTACGYYTEREIPPTGKHKLNDWEILSHATLTTDGRKTRSCALCKQTVNDEPIPAFGATYSAVAADEKLSVLLSQYTVVYQNGVQGAVFADNARTLASAIKALSGTAVSTLDHIACPADDTRYEILIGDTDRALSQSAKAKISGGGFAIVAEGKQIAIVGSSPVETMRGVRFLIDTYLAPAATATLQLPQSITVAAGTAVPLFAAGACNYQIVYSKEHPTDESLKGYPVLGANTVADKLAALTSLQASDIKRRSDESDGEKEICIGALNRPVEASLRRTLDAHEYAILVLNGRVYLSAHNDAALKICVTRFCELLALSGGALPEGFRLVGVANADWIVDFPRPTGEGISLYNSQYNNNNSLQFLYTGSGISAAAYQSYCATLLQNGYTVLWENSIGTNQFKTLINQSARIVLYVAYNDFAFEEIYKSKTSHDKAIRVISSPYETVNLPAATLLNKNQTYQKITDTTLTQLPFQGQAVGMGYILLLEDGRFLLIDGGGVGGDGSLGNEHRNLYNVLVALHTAAHGSAPSKQNPIHIAGWLITHSHWDHYRGFAKLLQDYGKSGLIKMDYLLGNFPEDSALYPVLSGASYMGSASTLATLKKYITGGFTYVKVHSGQRLYFANVEIEVFMTCEDLNPVRMTNSNETNTVTRWTVKNSNAPAGTAPVTIMFLGDSYFQQSRYLCAMYGTLMQSHVVQVAHHGNVGCEIPLYDAITPTVVLFPHKRSAYDNYTKPGNQGKGWQYEVDHHLVHEMESVRYIYVADLKNMTLTFTASGINHQNPYDALTKENLIGQSCVIHKTAESE